MDRCFKICGVKGIRHIIIVAVEKSGFGIKETIMQDRCYRLLDVDKSPE